jgi:hypothetical protein
VTITYDGSTTPPTNAGSYAVEATMTNANYDAGIATGTLVVNKATATISLSGLSHTYNGSPKSATASTNPTGLTVVSITYDGSTTPPTDAGSYAVVATLTHANYLATAANATLTISKIDQTITFAALGAKTFGDADFAVSATASSGLTVSFSATGSCTVSDTTLHITGAGSCTIRASQAGNTSYNPATDVNRSFSIGKATQTITFAALSGKTFGDADFGVSATANSGLTVTFTATGSCTVSGSLVHLTGAGSCIVRASQAGDANYNAATDVDQPFTIGKGTQTITFGALANKTFGDADFTVSATASSGLTVTFAAASGSCTVNGSSVHITGAGSCVVRASQAGNGNYNAAADVDQSFSIGRAGQTITFGALTNRTFGDADFGVSATSNAGLTVTFTALGSCTIGGATVHITGAGSCTIRASQGGDGNYDAAPDVDRSFTIAKANQAIAITAAVPASAIFGTAFTTSATGGGSGNAVSITTSGVCGVSSGGAGSAAVQMTSGTGTCSVSYSQAGDANYNAAPTLTANVAAAKAAQAITVTTSAPSAAAFGSSFTVAATGGGSGNAVTYTTPTGAGDGCSDAGPTFTVTSGVAACQVLYNQAGNANYSAATTVVQSVNVVGFAFEGFFSPIDMPTAGSNVRNKANAGQAIPVKWRLTLASVPVTSGASFAGLYSYEVSCTTGAGDVEDAIEEYAPGASGLTYDGDGRFHFNWKTPTTYKGKCRSLYVAFSDGSMSPVAYFKFN